MKKYMTTAVLLIVTATSAADEEDLLSLYGDEELISIATGYKKPISKAPAVASAITAEDIRKMGATDLDHVLETIPGMHISKSPLGYGSIYTFRGIYSSFNAQVLMLINGTPITNVYTGDRNLAWGGMPVEAISRIEVIRGPGSAVYGADAFAGVINIITKQGDEINGVQSGVRYGSFDTVEAWAQLGGSSDKWDYGFSLEYRDSDGHDEQITSDAQSFLDAITGTSASLAPGSVNTGNKALEARIDVGTGFWRLQSGYQYREIQSGAGAAQALDDQNIYTSDRFNTTISYHNDTLMNGDLDVEVKGSYLSTTLEVKKDLVLFPAGSTGPNFDPITNLPLFPDGMGGLLTYPEGMIGNPEVYEHHYRLDVSGLYRGFQSHEIRIGVGYHRGDMYKVKEEKNYGLDPANPGMLLPPGSPLIDVSDTPYAFITEGDRTNHYLFVQDAWQFANDWELTAGVRYDDYSDFGSTFNPRIAVVWSTSQNLTTKFLVGEAFRAPSFAETRNINNPTVLGNPDLQPEELRSYELVFDYKARFNLELIANLFVYQWDDIIIFAPDANGVTRTAQNAGEQTGRGVELEAIWDASDSLRLSGNYSWVDTTDERTNTPAGNAPQRQLYLRADWQFIPSWSLNLQANWVMDRERVAADFRPEIDDYLMVDGSLRFAPSESQWEAALLFRNLLNDDAYEPSPNGDPVAFIPNDLPLPGRSVFGEVRYRFH